MPSKLPAYPEYKPSGIDWLGDIPSHWGATKLKYYISISNGSDPVLKGVIPVYGTGEMPFKTCGEFKDGPTVLLGRKGSIDTPHWIEGKYWNVDTAFDTKVIRDYSLRFFWYVSNVLDINSFKSTTAVPSMTQSAYEGMVIPVPPIAEQEAIATYLDDVTGKVDALVAEKRKQVEDLRAYRNSLITETVTRGLNPDAALRPSGINWLGDIPEHWETTKLKYVGEARNGLTYSPDNICDKEDGTLVLRASNIQNDTLCFDDNVYVNKNIDKELMLNEDDILICSRNGSVKLIGKCVIIPSGVEATFGAFMMRYRSNLHNRFTLYLIRTTLAKYRHQFATSTINQLTNSVLGEMQIPLPPFAEQQAIAEFLDEKTEKIDALIDELNKQLDELAEYKKAVISEAVTGKVDVREWKTKN